MYVFCYGIRLNASYQEITCENRDRCPYFTNTRLGIALRHPGEYVEADTYNDKECELWQSINAEENRSL